MAVAAVSMSSTLASKVLKAYSRKALLSTKAWPDTPLPPTTSCGRCFRQVAARQCSRPTFCRLRAVASIFGSASNQNFLESLGWAAERTSTGRGCIMPKAGIVSSLFIQAGALYWPGLSSRAISHSMYWPHCAGTVTSPMCRLGLTPPAMPLKTTWLTLKRSSTNCVFMAALVMLMPERKTTTGLPSSVPVVNSTPLMLCLAGRCTWGSSTVSSGAKAEMTAMRGVSSSRTTVLPGAGAAQPATTAAGVRGPSRRVPRGVREGLGGGGGARHIQSLLGRRFWLAIVYLDGELARQDIGLFRLDLGHDVGGHLLLERAQRREFRALVLHHRVRAVVFGGELAFLDQLERTVDAGLHVPDGRCHHRVGVLRLGVDHVADGELALLLGRVTHAKALGVEHVGAFVDHCKGGFLGLRRVKPAVDEGDGELDLGIGLFGARHEGVHQAVDLGDGEATHHADLVRLGHAARDHAAEVRGLLDVVVEHAEVGRLGLAGGTEQKGRFGEVLGHLAGCGFHRKGLAQDELVAAGGVFAHHALVVGVAHILAGLVFDLATCFGGFQGLVDAADPLLLEGHRVDRRDLELGLRCGQ